MTLKFLILLIFFNFIALVLIKNLFKKNIKKNDDNIHRFYETKLSIFIQNLKNTPFLSKQQAYSIVKAFKHSGLATDYRYMYAELLLEAVEKGSYEALKEFFSFFENHLDEVVTYNNNYADCLISAHNYKYNSTPIPDEIHETLKEHPTLSKLVHNYLNEK